MLPLNGSKVPRRSQRFNEFQPGYVEGQCPVRFRNSKQTTHTIYQARLCTNEYPGYRAPANTVSRTPFLKDQLIPSQHPNLTLHNTKSSHPRFVNILTIPSHQQSQHNMI